MLGIRDLLTRNNKESEIFLIKTSQIIKGRIHKVVNSTLEDFKFNVDFRFGEAEIVINEGIEVKVQGLQPTCMFSCIIENKIKVFLEELKRNGYVQKLFFGGVKIENLNGKIKVRGKKIKISTAGLQIEIKLPIKVESYENEINNVLIKLEKLDFYISLVV